LLDPTNLKLRSAPLPPRSPPPGALGAVVGCASATSEVDRNGQPAQPWPWKLFGPWNLWTFARPGQSKRTPLSPFDLAVPSLPVTAGNAIPEVASAPRRCACIPARSNAQITAAFKITLSPTTNAARVASERPKQRSLWTAAHRAAFVFGLRKSKCPPKAASDGQTKALLRVVLPGRTTGIPARGDDRPPAIRTGPRALLRSHFASERYSPRGEATGAPVPPGLARFGPDAPRSERRPWQRPSCCE